MRSLLDSIGDAIAAQFESLSSIVAGAVAAIVGQLLQEYLTKRNARAAVEEGAFATAIESDDLGVLGAYLRDQLGSVSLEAYLSDKTHRERVDGYLKRLAELVHAPDACPVAEPRAEDAHSAEEVAQVQRRSSDETDASAEVGPGPSAETAAEPPILRGTRGKISDGDVWTAFAQLRREIERQLRDETQAAEGRPIAASVSFSDPDDEDAFRCFWHVASRAIHGEELTPADVEAGLMAAAKVFRAIEQHRVERLPF